MPASKKRVKFAICVADEGYDDLEVWKVYRVLPDTKAARLVVFALSMNPERIISTQPIASRPWIFQRKCGRGCSQRQPNKEPAWPLPPSLPIRGGKAEDVQQEREPGDERKAALVRSVAKSQTTRTTSTSARRCVFTETTSFLMRSVSGSPSSQRMFIAKASATSQTRPASLKMRGTFGHRCLKPNHWSATSKRFGKSCGLKLIISKRSSNASKLTCSVAIVLTAIMQASKCLTRV